MPIDLTDASLADEAFDIDSLSEGQQIRLTELLDEYLKSLEQNTAFDPEAACRDEPVLLDAVGVYLSKLNSLYGVGESNKSNVQIPQTLGAFSLVREIGRGGMGIVYEATQAGMDRRVALKLLPLAATFDARQISRFKNESRAAGSLHHPNIVPVYSVGEAEGVHYFAMQLIDGTAIDHWIQFRRQATNLDDDQSQWRTIVGWVVDIAEALHCAHESGVVHRDVKPSNLMIDGDQKIWITDFGLARCQSNKSLTQSGDLVGTMRYMSPEQAGGQSALVDGRSDIYSLAVTAYQMLALQPAHAGDDGPAILKSIDEHQITPLRHLCNSVPPDLETVICKAMSKHRDERYETAFEFALDLRQVLLGEPTVARPPSVADRIGRWVSKHRHAAMVAVAVVALGFLGFAISTAKISATAARLDRSEQLAREAVDRLGSQMAEQLVDIPAADRVRRALLSETLNYYEQFAKDAGDEIGLRHELAITYGKIGTFRDQLNFSDEAIDALQQSESIYQELAKESPFNSDAQLEWSISQNNLAETLHRAGRLEDAAGNFSLAIKTQTRLVETRQHAKFQHNLATTLNNLGLLLAETGAEEEAEERYLHAIELLQPDARQPDISHESQLASVLANLGGLLAKREPERAIKYSQLALVNQTDALQQDPRNMKLANQVVVTLNTLGSAQSQKGHDSTAIATFSRAIDIGEQLINRLPDQASYRRDLVISLNHLGLSLSKAGQLDTARQTFAKALEHQRILAKRFQSDAETHSMLGGVLNNLGFLHKKMGDPQAAAIAYTEAVDQQRIAVEIAPEVKRYRVYLQKHEHNLAEMKEAS